MKDKAERKRGHQVDQKVPPLKCVSRLGASTNFRAELEKKYRADRQIGPREKLMLPLPSAPDLEVRSSTTWAAISPKRTKIKMRTEFSRMLTNRRPSSVCIRSAPAVSLAMRLARDAPAAGARRGQAIELLLSRAIAVPDYWRETVVLARHCRMGARRRGGTHDRIFRLACPAPARFRQRFEVLPQELEPLDGES